MFFCLWACTQTQKVAKDKSISKPLCDPYCYGFAAINQSLLLSDSLRKCIKKIGIYKISEVDSLYIKKLSKQLEYFPNLEELELSFEDNYFANNFQLSYDLPIKRLEVSACSFYDYPHNFFYRNILVPYKLISRSKYLKELHIFNSNISLVELIKSINNKKYLTSLRLDAITDVSPELHAVLDSLKYLKINFSINDNRCDFVHSTLKAINGAKRLCSIDLLSSTPFKLPDSLEFPSLRYITTNRHFDSLSIKTFLEPLGKYWDLNNWSAEDAIFFVWSNQPLGIKRSAHKQSALYYDKKRGKIAFKWSAGY